MYSVTGFSRTGPARERVVSAGLLACFVMLWFVTGAIAQPSEKYSGGRDGEPINIVWFVAEDMGPDLGSYGEPQAHTPNLDRFAENGVRFTRAFTPTPVCSSSRSAFMTGMYAHSIDVQHHRSHRNNGQYLPAGVRVVTDWLRANGYTTGLIEKMPEPVDWHGNPKKDWNFDYRSPAGASGDDKPYDTRSWSELTKQEPFFAQVQISESHRGFHGPRKADPSKVDLPPYYPDHPIARKDWARYLDTVSVADRKFGQFMKLLQKEGHFEDTLVFFFADHGRAMVRGKQWPYDSGLQVPLLIQWPTGVESPEQYEAGTVDDRLVNIIDVTATTLWAAGVQPPMLMQGRVFYGSRADRLERSFVFGERGRGDETVFRIRTVRSKRYRYIRNYYPDRPFLQRNAYKERAYPMMDLLRRLHFEGKLTPVQENLLDPDRPAEELYYIPDDPHEINNLADSDDPEHRAARQRLRGALQTWIETTNDQGRFPEDPEVIKRWKTKFDRRFERWAETHPEEYKRFKKLKKEWKRAESGAEE